MVELYLHSPICAHAIMLNFNNQRDNFTYTSEVSKEIMGFWAVTLCSLVGGYEHFGGYTEDTGSMIR
jgi:hypothetical protein